MKRLIRLIFGWIGAGLIAMPAVAAVVHSRSGQFLVRGTPTAPMIVGPGVVPFPTPSKAETNIVTLDPDLLAVSAERIKQGLLRELELPDAWRGQIYLDLLPTPGGDQPIQLTSVRYLNGWQYHLEIPDRVERQKGVRGIVQVLLLEIANRNGGERSGEIPAWLIEGLTLQLMRSAQADLMLQPETEFNRQLIRPDPLAAARGYLRTHPALTFTALSLPTSAQLSGDAWRAYQDSAQELVHDLLRLRGGRACLVNMLLLLPDCWNWQTAFLRAFAAHFHNLLDVEKWWAVSLADFTGRDQWLAWPRNKSLQKLDEILGLPVQVRYATNRLPATADLTLQTVIAQWDFAHQKNVLQAKANQLLALRPNVPTDFVPLVDAYRLTLLKFVAQNESSGFSASSHSSPAIRPQVLRREAIRRLDALDARRQALWQQVVQATNAPVKLQP